jgi:hypothetical protein
VNGWKRRRKRRRRRKVGMTGGGGESDRDKGRQCVDVRRWCLCFALI